MKPGDVIERAVWLDGRETAEMLDHWKTTLSDELARTASEHDFMLAPVTFTAKRPGDERVPEVPGHISGPDVRFLVAETSIVCRMPKLVVNSFLGDLDKVDLERLRIITRKAHRQHYPHVSPLTDQECDIIIERLGPDAALDAVRKGVDSQAIH